MAEYTGTRIAADGKRYDIDDEDAPTTAPVPTGKMVTAGSFEDRVAPIEDELSSALVRSVTDGVTTATDATVTSATAAFSAADKDARIEGTGIPANATIATINSATSVEISAVATASGTGRTLTITRTLDTRFTNVEDRVTDLENA